MRQNEFILKVTPVNSLDAISKEDYVIDGYTIAIDAWDLSGVFMIDTHITGLYPQLERMGIQELAEGTMAYSGNLSADEVIGVLQEWGFMIEGDAKHLAANKGEHVECKITPMDDEDEPYMEPVKPEKSIGQLKREMERAVSVEDYERAAKIRDEIKERE
jgi:hypothetical protein